jgi:hypothetical protein
MTEEARRFRIIVPTQAEESSSGHAGSGFFSFFGRHWLMLTFGVILLVILGLFGGLSGGLLKQLAILFKTLVEDANFGADLLAWVLQQLNQCKDTPTPLCRVFEIIAAVLLGQKIGLNKALYDFVKFLADKMKIYKPSPQAEELNSAADIRAVQQGEPQQEARMRENTIVINPNAMRANNELKC